MSSNPFVGSKAPWIRIYTNVLHGEWKGEVYALTELDSKICICRCKDLVKAAFHMYHDYQTVLITIDDYNYGYYEAPCGPYDVRKANAYEHLIYLWQLHQAFYSEQ